MSSGMDALPVSTLAGLMSSSFTTSVPPCLSDGSARSASIFSKAIAMSASPSPMTMDATSEPMAIMVETAPPRWAMPWISETLTSCPLLTAASATMLAAKMVPCPPTPHSSIFFMPAS